jgi:hypothetical protein
MTGYRELRVRSENPHLESPSALRLRLDYSDERLRSECSVHTHRTGGPGGQHRNKTESAVRLHHRPSGLVVTGQERRSQHQNTANALERLREALAIGFRAPLPPAVAWPPTVSIRDEKLRVSPENAGYFHALGLALDALATYGGVVQDAAAYLGVTASSLAKFLHANPRAWTAAQAIRSAAGLPPLRP